MESTVVIATKQTVESDNNTHSAASFRQISSVILNDVINSLTSGRFQWNFVWIIFKLISVIDGGDIACESVLRWISLDLSSGTSTLVQVMAWCRQATSNYLSQWWPSTLSPYGVIRHNELNVHNIIGSQRNLELNIPIFCNQNGAYSDKQFISVTTFTNLD